MSSLLPQATPSAAWTSGGKAFTAPYRSMMPQNLISAPAQLQAPPTTAGTDASATTATTAGMAGTAGMATMAHIAPQTGLFSDASTLKIQDTPFQSANMPNPSWQFITPNLPPCAQMTKPAFITEREQLL